MAFGLSFPNGGSTTYGPAVVRDCWSKAPVPGGWLGVGHAQKVINVSAVDASDEAPDHSGSLLNLAGLV